MRQIDTLVGIVYGAWMTYLEGITFAVITGLAVIFLWFLIDDEKGMWKRRKKK